ncbi:unnamed protein product [Diabrotica balteata]|uniref:Uncharacterized protein n=1 Tax=Diabrotica balteata TaxID=107213 RepID=A0A9N9TBH2_DIABA|nr:unnamed protein product [Diabrotica balteata]
MLAACIDLKSRLPWPNMKEAMASAGINMVFDAKSVEDFKNDMNTDIRYKKFLEQWRTKHREFNQSYLIFIYSCVILTSMTKALSDNNYEGWFNKRIKDFSGTLGDTFTPENSNLGT